MIKHVLIVLLVILPLGGAIYLFAKRGAPTTSIRTQTTPDAPALVRGNVSIVGTEGQRLFAISQGKMTIDGVETSFPSRYYWCEAFRKRPDQSMDVDGLIVIVNPTPTNAAERDALLTLKPTDDIDTRHRSMLDALDRTTGLTAAHAVLEGAEAIEQSNAFQLRHSEIRVAPKNGGESSKLVSEDARAALTNGAISSLDTIGPFDFTRGWMHVTGETLSATASLLTIERAIEIGHIGASASSQPTTEGFAMSGGGPLRYEPKNADLKPTTVFELLRLSGGEIDVRGGVRVAMNGMIITATRLHGVLSDATVAESRPSSSTPFESITFNGNVVAAWHGLELKSDEATIHLTGTNAFTITTPGHSELEWNTSPTSLAPTASRGMSATSEAGLVFVYAPATSKSVPDPKLTMTKNVILRGNLGPGRGVELYGDALDFTLAHPDRATNGARPALDFRKAELTGHSRGKVGPWLVEGSKLTHDRHIDANGIVDADIVVVRGPSASVVSDPALAESATEKQEIYAQKSITIERAASPYGISKMNAEGTAVFKRTDREGLDTLSGESLSAQMSAATTDLASGKTTPAKLAKVDAKGKVKSLDHRGRTIEGEVLHLEIDPLLFDVTGNPAIVRGFFDTKDPSEKSEFTAPHVTLDRAKGRLFAERGVHAVVPLGDVDLFTNPADRLGASRRGNPFTDRAPKVPTPWIVDCTNFEAVQSGITGGGSFAETGRITLKGNVDAKNGRKSVKADFLEYDLGTKHGSARGKPVHVTSRAGDADEVEDDVKAAEIIFDPASTYLRDHCDVTVHVPQGASVETSAAALSQPATQYETLHVTSATDALLSAGNIFFSGKTTMENTPTKGAKTSMTADAGKVVLEAGADGKPSMNLGRVQRIEGYGTVEFRTGSIVGKGDIIVVRPTESTLTLIGTDRLCELVVGKEPLNRAKVINHNTKTGVTDFRDARSGSSKR